MAIKKIKLPDNTAEDINDPRLPVATTTDNGKLLGVDGGIWSKVNKPSYTLDEVSDGSTRKLANYLPLAGGYIQSASGYNRLRVTTDSNANYIQSWASDTASANLNISGYNGNAGSNLYLKFDNIYAWSGSANKVVYHAGNLTQSVVTGLIGSTTYAPYNANGYLPLSGGTLTGPLTKSGQVVLSLSRTDSYFTAIEFLGKVDGTVDTALGRIGYNTDGAWVRDASDTAYRYILHTGNFIAGTNYQKPITVSTSEPTSSDGENGDIWIVV